MKKGDIVLHLCLFLLVCSQLMFISIEEKCMTGAAVDTLRLIPGVMDSASGFSRAIVL